MPIANTALRVSDLDFNSIRNNLKNYLRSQSEFTDYDFEGSGLSVLLDVLAYNTYYNSFYLNMAANEAFLDTAQLRNNILSQAKLIGYVPTSRRAAQAKVNVVIIPTSSEDQSVNFLSLEQYTRLLGADVEGTNYPFVAINSNTAYKSGGSFSFSNVVIKQGEVMTHQFIMTANNTQRKFEIPSANVDTSTLRVTVQESASNTQTKEFNLFADITEVTANSLVYFIEENDNLNYTVQFGDGVIGYKPKVGNIITTTYLDTLGSQANNITKFSFIEPVGGYFRGDVTVTPVSGGSYGGTEKESVDQIKFRAPHFYTTQNRAVTVQDYETIITKDYNNIDAVSIWGGEDNDPVMYGKVFISLKTKGYYALTNLEKENIKNSLIENRNMLTIVPEIIDPEYVFMLIRGKVFYNPNLTSKSSGQLSLDVVDAISDYNTTELNSFKSTFKKSKLQYFIESSDPSITGSDIEVYLQRQITLIPNTNKKYELKFNTALKKGDFNYKLYSFPQISILDSSGVLRNVFIEETPNSFTGVDSIDVVNPGTNYDVAPEVTITGDGTGATATAVVLNNKVNRIIMTNKGSNYTTATVTIKSTSGLGAGATATAKLEAKYGTLRTFYYKSNGEKIVVAENIGDINYTTGLINITNLTPRSVIPNAFYDDNVLTINVVPQNQVISPLRNRILVIDPNNTQSIQLEMVPTQ